MNDRLARRQLGETLSAMSCKYQDKAEVAVLFEESAIAVDVGNYAAAAQQIGKLRQFHKFVENSDRPTLATRARLIAALRDDPEFTDEEVSASTINSDAHELEPQWEELERNTREGEARITRSTYIFSRFILAVAAAVCLWVAWDVFVTVRRGEAGPIFYGLAIICFGTGTSLLIAALVGSDRVLDKLLEYL